MDKITRITKLLPLLTLLISAAEQALPLPKTGAAKLAVEDAAASVSFQRLALLPLVLLAVFGAIWLRERGKSRADAERSRRVEIRLQ